VYFCFQKGKNYAKNTQNHTRRFLAILIK